MILRRVVARFGKWLALFWGVMDGCPSAQERRDRMAARNASSRRIFRGGGERLLGDGGENYSTYTMV